MSRAAALLPVPERWRESDVATIIPAAARLCGDMEIEESIVFKCIVEGNVRQVGPHVLILASSGGIKGEVHATRAIIGGTVEGDVQAQELVVLPTGKIFGNVTYSTLTVDEGGTINGELRRVVANVVAASVETQGPQLETHAGQNASAGLHAVPRPAARDLSQEDAA